MNRNIFFGYKYALTLVMLATILCSTKADLGPGWHTQRSSVAEIGMASSFVTVPASAVTPPKTTTDFRSKERLKKPSPILAVMSAEPPDPCDEAYITPEIQGLADGLMRDPKLIFDYVHNRIDYSHYFGVRKGAQLTLLERSGNDFDQCSLLVALLRAAGYEARYGFGMRAHPYSDVSGNDIKHLLRVTASDPSANSYVSYIYKNCGFPDNTTLQLVNGVVHYAWPRVWVEVTQGESVLYYLDPAFKRYEQVAAGINLTAASGLTKSGILSASGASGQSGHKEYSQNLNENSLKSHLASAANSVAGAIQTDQPNATVEDIVGGWRLVESETTALNSTWFPNVLSSWNNGQYSFPVQRWSNIPDTFHSKLSVTVGGATKTYKFSCLQGRRLSLIFSESSQAQLWIDDGKVDGAAGPDWEESGGVGTSVNATVTINHPQGSWNFGANPQTLNDTGEGDQVSTQQYLRTGKYAIVYGFDVSPEYVESRQRKLAGYKSAGVLDTDWKVVTESLNALGISYMAQVTAVTRAINEQWGMLGTQHHLVGRIGQETSYYLDIFASGSFLVSRAGKTTVLQDESIRCGDVRDYFASALEHGVLEQNQDISAGASASSTIRLFQRANADVTQKIFRATAANWTAGANIKSQLILNSSNPTEGWLPGNIPPDPDINPADDLVPPSGQGYLLIPQKGRLGLGGSSTWKGYAYLTATPSWGIAAIDTANGGFFGNAGSPPISTLVSFSLSAPEIFIPTPITVAPVLGGDPVDLASGAFMLSQADLTVGQEAPRGFNFVRDYNSARVVADYSQLGYGWTHNWNCQITEASDPLAGLGRSIPQSSVAMLAAIKAASLAYDPSTSGSAAELVTVALIANWAVDQLRHNAVNITMGSRTIQFIKQPYTSGGATVYTPGAGITHSLTKDGSGNYQLKERNGRTFHFTTVSGQKKLTKIQDLYGKELNVLYDASGRVEFVKDCWAGANQRVLTFVYNATTGRLDKIYDNTMTPRREVNFGYNAAKQLVSVTDPEGKTWTYEYVSSVVNSEDHRIQRVKDAFTPQRVVVENVYDPLGRVKEQFNEGVAARSWKYHYGGYVTIEEKPPVSPATVGDLTYHYFDRRWRSVGNKDALGNRSILTYDGQDHIVSQTDARGKTTYFEYDGRHNLTKITDPLQKTVRRYYDALDRLDYEDDKNNKRTDYAYQGNLPLVTSITRPYASALTAVEQFQYYPDTSPNYGLLQNHTDPENKVTSYTYDVRGNVWTVTRPAISGQPAAVIVNTYTTAGDLDTVTDARAVVTDYDYNRRRQPTKVTVLQASGNVVSETHYDANGKPWKTIDPKLNETTQTYTADGRPLVTTFPPVDGATPFAETVYDVRNYVEKQRNSMQPPEEVVLGYDAAGRLLTQKDPKLRVTTFGYDENGFKGFRTSVTSPLSTAVQKTQFAYNDRGEQTIVTDANGKQTVTTYDDNGNPDTLLNRRLNLYDRNYYDDNRLKELKTPVDAANNRKTSYEYDKRGLVTKVTEPSGQRIENTVYDNRGRLVTQVVKDAAGTVQATAGLTYDPNDNVLTHSEGSVTITRTYDDFNRVESYTYSEGAGVPDNYTINYKYDKNGNLIELTCSAYPGSQKVFYGYDSHNRLTTVTDWANRVTVMGHDLAGRLTSILRPNGTKRVVTYSEAGEVVQIEERGPGGIPFHLIAHSYDSGGRPDIEFAAPVPTTVTDTSITSPGTVYDADNALSTFNGQVVTRDFDGNMTAGPLNAATSIAYAYDTRNRLTSVAAQGTAPALSYGYDPAGNRISLTQGATTTRYVVNPAGLSQVLVRNVGGVKTYYVYGPGLLYQVAQDEQTLSYHYDLRGSTVATTGDAGSVVNRIQYSSYGRVTQRTGYNAAALVFLFNGSYGVLTDPNGLLHMRARYYNPYTRRFLNADPIGFAGGMNWYAYADGNPITRMDPSGNLAETLWDVANIGMGVYSAQDNWRNGNWGWFALDVVGLAYDGVATAVPFLPAGASAAFKATRAGNSVMHSVNAGLDVANVSSHVHDAARAIDTTASNVPWQAALDGSQLHRQVASQTSDSMRYFDTTYMAGANRSSGIQPDMIGGGIWADITTPRQWPNHSNHYTPGFGEGIPIMYQRGVGVVGTTRLLPGAGLGFSFLQSVTGGGGAFAGLGGLTGGK